MMFFGLSRCGLIFEDTSISPEKPTYLKIGDTIIYESGTNVDSFYVEEASLYAVGEDDGSGEEWDHERYYSRIIQFDCVDSCYSFGVTIIPNEYWVGVFGFEYLGFELEDYDKRYAGLTLQIGEYKLGNLYRSYSFKADSISGKEISSVLYS